MAADNKEAHSLCEQLLADTDPDVRCHAALGLLRAGNYRTELWQALSRFLHSSFPHIEPAVREFFAVLPTQAEKSLLLELEAENPDVRLNAAEMLHRMGRADERVTEAVLRLLVAKEFNMRFEAADLLQIMARESEQVAEVVLRLMDDEDPATRLRAAGLYLESGRSNSVAVQVILQTIAPQEPVFETCYQVLSGQALTAAGGKLLAELVRPRDEDSELNNTARRQMFDWLWQTLEPKMV